MKPLTRGDVLWGYIAQVLNIGAGLILLPILLRNLSPEDVGLWFVFISLAALAQLLELARTAPGFRDDIGRRALISLFALLGGEHELTRSYRSRLAGLAT